MYTYCGLIVSCRKMRLNTRKPFFMEAPDPDAVTSTSEPRIYFVFQKASLEAAKVGKGYQILNSDEHANYLRRSGKEPADYRPDIIHQELLAVLDSPLNKAGKIAAVFVHTQKNVWFRVSPHTRIPRTFKRFCGLMVQLLQKFSIRASNGSEKLLKIFKGPISQYVPTNIRRVGLSFSAPAIQDLNQFVKDLPCNESIVFIIGAMSHGSIDSSYTDEFISVSQFPLSGAYCVSRITNCLENKYDIL